MCRPAQATSLVQLIITAGATAKRNNKQNSSPHGVSVYMDQVEEWPRI